MKAPMFVSFVASLILQIAAWAEPADSPALSDLAERAVAPDSVIATAATAQLRDAGPAGLDAILSMHADGIRALNEGQTDATLKRLQAAIEAVSGQRDCHASRLYWFTDFAKAQAAARASGKPILSLRLLGRLDEEFSCANSRFFRTTLYANQEIGAYLRDHFILHWKSVRPAPKLTIDFGDGRVVQRTITGNSIHYALDADGAVIDALPGLYGSQAFLAWLKRIDDVALRAPKLPAPAREAFLRAYHEGRLRLIEQEWANDLQSIRSESPALKQAEAIAIAPTAAAAGARARAKGAAEMPILRASMPDFPPAESSAERRTSRRLTTDAQWARIAAIHAADAQLDPGALALIRAKSPAREGGLVSASGLRAEDPLFRALQNFKRSVAEDTVRNEYLLHTHLHEWLAARPAHNVDTLNTRVYAELFLTPESDPWLGLLPADTFTALENDGRK